MSIEGRKISLQAKHAELERRIDEMMSRPSCSDLDLADLKKEKLAIKDELVQIEKAAAQTEEAVA